MRIGGRRPWQDLAPELLELVFLRVSSHVARVRFRAVCRPWRAAAAAAAAPPVPLLPLLALRNAACVLSLPEGTVHRVPVPVPDDVIQSVSTGAMLFLVHRDGGCSLMDPLSTTITPQHISPDCLWPSRPSKRQRAAVPPFAGNISKVVVADHVVAVRTGVNLGSKKVALSARGPRGRRYMAWEWDPPHYLDSVVDIALFRRKLYVLTRVHNDPCRTELYVLEDNLPAGDVTYMQCICSEPPARPEQSYYHRADPSYYYYLVSSGDRLLMVMEHAAAPAKFEVFEAAGLGSGHGRWSKIETLDGRALFVSKGCSKSLPAGELVGAREDHIYFISKRDDSDNESSEELHSGVYSMKEGKVAPLPLETTGAWQGRAWPPTWFFPTRT
ncbi:uncharacterized protein LOC119357698 [Triticum dicoccoides]|uniref:uncharacterized protein LOC119357698 n=1 Tax=Triticum dicoccoides TaxID=85692 RepID=UPI0008440D60|nr:uncharacterized protein LOC119357698 [Triticum dicoccoides]